MEYPNEEKEKSRREIAWTNWISFDNSLRDFVVLGPNWARAKMHIRHILRDFHLGSVEFTNGSEFMPTFGFNSIESKLEKSVWTCTHENFDLWADTVYRHRGLKFAMRKRFAQLLADRGINQREFDRYVWLQFRGKTEFARRIFELKLMMVTDLVHGNRFSTVPKNNLKDRPICIEPLANILVQRRIGSGIRECLKHSGVDLNITAEKHRHMISSDKFATIDLENASDSISLQLCQYLFPSRVFNLIKDSRSAMTLGFDDNFHVIKKVSSMGNGFTFELMSLILYCLSRSFTASCSVFGDDIIVPNDVADKLVESLELGNFRCNVAKTHIRTDYRESCGAHHLDGYGYIESFDFKYPQTVNDVMTILNKLSFLAERYHSFCSLFCAVYTVVPPAWFADNPLKVCGIWLRPPEPFGLPKVDNYAVMSPLQFRKDGMVVKKSARRRLDLFGQMTQQDTRGATMHLGFEWSSAGTSPAVLNPRSQWAKYLMYLASGRRCINTILGKGAFKSYVVVTLKSGLPFRWSDIVAATKT